LPSLDQIIDLKVFSPSINLSLKVLPVFKMTFDGEIFDGEDFKFAVQFSTDIREQLMDNDETEANFEARLQKITDKKLKKDLSFIVNFDSYIYNCIYELIHSEINDYANKNDLDFHEYENFECENKKYTFYINGRIFVFEK
jgi:hypothetical protein